MSEESDGLARVAHLSWSSGSDNPSDPPMFGSRDPMPRKPKAGRPGKGHATAAELTLLDALWGRGELTVRDISRFAYGREPRTTAQYATIQSLLDRLQRKGLVARNRER